MIKLCTEEFPKGILLIKDPKSSQINNTTHFFGQLGLACLAIGKFIAHYNVGIKVSALKVLAISQACCLSKITFTNKFTNSVSIHLLFRFHKLEATFEIRGNYQVCVF